MIKSLYMLLILFGWIVFFTYLSIVGLGLLVIMRLLKKDTGIFEVFLSGLVGVIIYLQFVSLISPINDLVGVGIFFASLLILLIKKKLVLYWIKSRKPRIRKGNLLIYIFIALIVSILTLYHASMPVTWYDTGLYHLTSVRWISEYPAIPGLAHIHSRIGFNNSFLLFASLIDSWMFSSFSPNIMSSLIYVCVFIKLVTIIFEKINNRNIKIFSLVFIGFLINKLTSTELSSLSNDFTASLVLISGLIMLLENKSTELFLILATLLITIKLNMIFFFIYALYKYLNSKNNSVINLIPAFLILLGFVIRNIILTGWVLYPLPYAELHLPWALSKEEVIKMSNIIKSWARMPGKGYEQSLSNGIMFWLPKWYERYKTTMEFTMLYFSTTLLLLNKYYSNKLLTNLKRLNKYKEIFIVSLVSIIYIFYKAPDLRFFQIFSWAIFATTLVIVCETIDRFSSQLFTLIIVTQLTIIGFGLGKVKLSENINYIKPQYPRYYELGTALINPENMESGSINVFMPINDDRCYDSPIPCTPYLDNKIIYRKGRDIRKGFMLEK